MGKITRRNSTDREQTARPRKRRKKDLDRIHSKILLARQKLDNVGKDDDGKTGQKKQNRTKICNRLLPEPTAGIYRNGAKGKDIQKAETSENTFHKARLKADALKLFYGDTHGSKCIVEIPTRKTTEHSPNKDCIKNSLIWAPSSLEQSPVLEKKLSPNQKLCLVKKKDEKKIFKNTNFNKIKQNVNDESKHVQKEDMCKRRLFQNDREQLESVATPSTTQISNNTDFAKENKTNKKETEQICSKNSKDSSCKSPLSRYTEFCKIISAKNFETDILPNYNLDPVATTIKKLRNTYANSFRQQLLRKRDKQKLENVEPSYSEEYQACTFSDSFELSPVEFEVPKCSENHTVAVCRQEGLSQKNDKFHLTQNADLRKSNGMSRYNSCTSRNTSIMYNTNGSVMENCENNNTQRSKESKNIQVSKSINFDFMKDKESIQLDSYKNFRDVDHPSKSNRHDKDNFSIKISDYGNSRCIDKSKALGTTIVLNNSIVSKKHLKDYSREKLSIAVSSNYVPDNQKCNNRATNKNSVKNVKRVPTILRRYNNVTNNKLNHSVQVIDDYTEDLYKKCESILFNRIPSNSIEKELYEATFPNVLKNLSATSTIKTNTMNAILDQRNILEPQIGSIKIKDSQEFETEQFDINIHSNDGRNKFYRCDDSLYPRSLETLDNTNTYSEKLLQQEQITPDVRKYLSDSNDYHSIKNYLQNVSFSNSNVESTKELPQQTKLHVCKTNKQPFCRKNTRNRNQSILFNNVNNRAMPTSILNLHKNIQSEKISTEPLRLFDKTDVECTKNQINQNACRCTKQYIYLDSTNCQPKYKEQAHCFKETAQSESLCNTRSCNNGTDNCVNLSSTMQNVPLLSLKQENLYPYPKAIDDQHRAVLLQNVTQPVKYLAVTNGSDIQRIPVYINDRDIRVTENVPLKVIALMDPNTQIKAFPQEIAKVIPLQTNSLHFNDLATRKMSDQSIVKHLDSVNAIVINPNSQSNVWYTSNL